MLFVQVRTEISVNSAVTAVLLLHRAMNKGNECYVVSTC